MAFISEVNERNEMNYCDFQCFNEETFVVDSGA